MGKVIRITNKTNGLDCQTHKIAISIKKTNKSPTNKKVYLEKVTTISGEFLFLFIVVEGKEQLENLLLCSICLGGAHIGPKIFAARDGFCAHDEYTREPPNEGDWISSNEARTYGNFFFSLATFSIRSFRGIFISRYLHVLS